MKWKCFVLLPLVFLVGCAAPKLNPDVSSHLQQNTIATAVFYEKKTVRYDEMVYKVLWNETRQHVSTFDGLWDIDKEMSELMSNGLTSAQLNSVPIHSIMTDDKVYSTFVSEIVTPSDAEEAKAPLRLGQEIRQHLQREGIDYLLLYKGYGFSLFTTTMNSSSRLNSPATLMIYDVNTDKEEYSEFVFMGAPVKWEESPREIEENDMAGLKKATTDMIEQVSVKYIPEVLGIAEAN